MGAAYSAATALRRGVRSENLREVYAFCTSYGIRHLRCAIRRIRHPSKTQAPSSTIATTQLGDNARRVCIDHFVRLESEQGNGRTQENTIPEYTRRNLIAAQFTDGSLFILTTISAYRYIRPSARNGLWARRH